jgi:1-acyl-sn-glycerol-3-phosphate acyltransferase
MILYHLPALIMREFGIPEGFILLVMYLPNVLLIGLYFMFPLSKSQAFCNMRAWEYMRTHHFKYKTFTFLGGKKVKPGIEWPKRQVIYAVAPHAIFAESVTFFFTLNKAFEKVTTVATSLLFCIPIVRECACLAGVIAANTANIAHELNTGKSLVIHPEGMRGALHINESNGIMNVLRGLTGGESDPRKGFIRCAHACSHEVAIVPVYNQGAEKTYTTFHIFPWFQKRMLRNYYYPWPLVCFGWYGSFWPKPVQINVIMGKPISCVGKTVDEIHEEYCSAMEQMISLAFIN